MRIPPKIAKPGENVYSSQFVTVYKNPCCRLTNGIFNLKCNTVKIHKLQAKERAGPWSGHNVMKWCVRLAKRLVCQVKVCVCENWGKPRGERRSGQGQIILEIRLAISQACMFQIFTKNLLFILQSTFFQICVLNILKCLHMNL